MADVATDKKLKLASTKKRFKELQELKKKREESTPLSENSENIQSKTPSTHSSNRSTPLLELEKIPLVDYSEKSELNLDIVVVENTQLNLEKGDNSLENAVENTVEDSQEQNPSILPNYFDTNNSENTEAFFDNIPYFNTNEHDKQYTESENIGLPMYFDNTNSSDVVWENTIKNNDDNKLKNDEYKLFPDKEASSQINDKNSRRNSDVLGADYPEMEKIALKLREYANKVPGNSPFGSYATQQSIDNEHKLMELLNKTGATEEEKLDICSGNKEIDNASNLTKKEIQHSINMESLKQLSNQIGKMLEPSDCEFSATSDSISVLERRNIQLAEKLQQQQFEAEQLRAVNLELQAKITQLEEEKEESSTKKQSISDLQIAQEVSQLRNQLQTHLQTIGLLVAEKTELSSSLSQYEINWKQKTGDCEELQTRLKASRSRVTDLERELSNLKSDKIKVDNLMDEYSNRSETFKEEYEILKEQKDELAQELLEVREKLKTILEENVKLKEVDKDVRGKLALAEIKIQQISLGNSLGMDNQLAQLTEQKFALESEISNLSQMVKSIIKERDDSTVQYQQYGQQLNAQIENLSMKLTQLQQDKENLIIQDQERIKHIGTLERQLQNLQNDEMAYATRNANNLDVKKEFDKSRELCVQLHREKTAAEENYTKVFNEKELINKDLAVKMDTISQLETFIEHLRGSQPDNAKLLAAMESDKVAASRAIEQNKELKQQLSSMKEVFMKMDDDKVVLTENLKAQQLTNKELIEKLETTETTLHSLADAIEIKDQEIRRLVEASEDLAKHAIEHEHFEDKLRHFEANDNSVHALQHELLEAKQTINKLRNEHHQAEKDQLRISEIEHIQKNVDEGTYLKLTNGNNEPSSDLENSAKVDDIIDSSKILNENNKSVIDKENVLKYLEEKVKKTMQEIANLIDEKHRLEHIVLQLQGETETIGEYVALYQHQRMVLKQKALEKDEQFKQLANDREEMKIKLNKLNELIRKLVVNKEEISTEVLQQHEISLKNHIIDNNLQNHETAHNMHEDNIIEPYHKEPSAPEFIVKQTAEDIINLISEIKTSNLIEPSEHVHHCPCCSGQLMTV